MARKFNLNAANNMLKEKEPKAKTAKEEKKEDIPESKVVQSLIGKIEEAPPINTAFNFKFVKRNKIVFHKNNDYPMEDIEKLSKSILEYGLLHNLEGYYDLETDTYTLESGERRTRAIDLLFEKFKEWPEDEKESQDYKRYLQFVKPFENGLPMNVKSVTPSAADSESEKEIAEIDSNIRTILANEDVRTPNSIRTKNKIDELTKWYERKNAIVSSPSEKVNINEKIAEQLNIDKRQVTKYKKTNSLIPELYKKFEEQKITLTDGANYASLTEEEQRQILVLIENGENKADIDALYDKLKKLELKISQKEKEISTLEQQKIQAEKKVVKAEELRKEIEQELRESSADAQEIKKLEMQLQNAQKAIEAQKEVIQKAATEHEKVIANLEKQLAEREQVAQKDVNIVIAEQKLISASEEILKDISSLDDAFRSFQNVSNEAPDTFKEKLNEINEKLKKYIK